MCQVKCYAFPEYFWGLTLVFNLAGYGVRLPYTCHMVRMHPGCLSCIPCVMHPGMCHDTYISGVCVMHPGLSALCLFFVTKRLHPDMMQHDAVYAM